MRGKWQDKEGIEQLLRARLDNEEKSLRGFKRLASHPATKAFVMRAAAEDTPSISKDGSKRKQK